MQSCPYEPSVLRKFYFEYPTKNITLRSHSLKSRRLSRLTFVNDHTFVYQFRGIRNEVILPIICCLKKLSVYSDNNNPEIPIINDLYINLYNAGHDSCNLMVSALLLLYQIRKTNKWKKLNCFKITLGFFCSGTVDQNVKWFPYRYFQLKYFLRIYLFLLNSFVQFIWKFITSNVMNGCYIDSDMEVESQKLNQIIKEETPGNHYELGRENEYLAVISDVKNMKEPECTQVSSSLKCVNYSDSIDIKESVEMVANGDKLINCIANNGTETKKINLLSDDTCVEIDSKLFENNIGREVCNGNEVNGTDVYIACKINENDVCKEDCKKDIKEEKGFNNCEVKTNDYNVEKEKTKSKDNSTSNSISSKKTDEQSSSHHSSSSSSSRSKYKDYKSSSHRSSSSSKSCSDRSRSDAEKSKYESSDKKKSRSCHHKSDEKCHCKLHHHSRHHSKSSKKFQSVKTQCSADEIAYELRRNKPELANPYFTRVPWVPHPQLANLKYGRFYRIEVDRNGGASTVHLYMDEINHLSESQMKECAVEFIKLSYSEDENECAYHVMGIVHGAATYLPDLVDYMADHYPTLTVKTGSLASRDNHTTTMSQYRDEVYKTYSNGTFRYAPLDQLSICGVLGEEVGAYFPDFVARLEQSPFMKPVMPWSSLSVVETDNPRESNDGPIFWVRPGEQMLPANEALKESARPKKRRNNELDNLAYIAGSRSSEARESLFMDRTKAHADQVGVDYGLSNTAPTAAVGVLKSVNCGHPEHGNRATKDVVAFHAQDYNELLEILMLDLYEPPQTQCTKWIEVSKLNTLRREGIRYAHVQLHDNDVYYLPRKIIHQFQTISSVASVAWHIRYKDYFSIMGAPNLHTPTGINKGQVFYEKKNVAVYYPPVCENDLLASVANPGSPFAKTPKKYEKLKEYSPFKHSPRKNHKIHSPRTSSKKDRSVSVPQTPTKKESESNEDERRSSSIKKERAKSDECDSSSKREREISSSKKSECSSHHQSSDHSSAKERKDSHESNHRKEVKNLESEFDSKRSKSKSGKSDKCGHDGRKSDEGKPESSSRHKRHDDSKGKFHSKHERSSSHKKSESVSNGPVTEKEEKHEKNTPLKRKNSDTQGSCPMKKTKEEDLQKDNMVVENKDVNESATAAETRSELATCGNSGANIADVLSVKVDSSGLISEPQESESIPIDVLPSMKCETNENNTESAFTQEAEQTDVLCQAECNDLRHSSTFGSLSADINPPLPCTSPPSNPPLPPNSPLSDLLLCAAAESSEVHSREEPATFVSPVNEDEKHRELQDQCNVSKDVFQGKKVKKKIVKKVKEEGECYDLLGDIMSQMDKKK